MRCVEAVVPGRRRSLSGGAGAWCAPAAFGRAPAWSAGPSRAWRASRHRGRFADRRQTSQDHEHASPTDRGCEVASPYPHATSALLPSAVQALPGPCSRGGGVTAVTDATVCRRLDLDSWAPGAASLGRLQRSPSPCGASWMFVGERRCRLRDWSCCWGPTVMREAAMRGPPSPERAGRSCRRRPRPHPSAHRVLAGQRRRGRASGRARGPAAGLPRSTRTPRPATVTRHRRRVER